jgi:hypothetical protein
MAFQLLPRCQSHQVSATVVVQVKVNTLSKLAPFSLTAILPKMFCRKATRRPPEREHLSRRTSYSAL